MNTYQRDGGHCSARTVSGTLLLLACIALGARAVTTIQIGDAVLVSNCTRFGVNLGGDAYYSGAAYAQVRKALNFEGTAYRQCHTGTLFEDGFATESTSTSTLYRYNWDTIARGAQFTIISGPNVGVTGTIVGITNRLIRLYSTVSNVQPMYVFDRLIPLPGGQRIEDAGLLLDNIRIGEGNFQRNAGNDYWITTNTCAVQIGDVPPGSSGVAALRMNGSAATAQFRLSTTYQRYADNNGTWRARFWAKRADGSPTATVNLDNVSTPSQTVTLSNEWCQHELTFVISDAQNPTTPTDSGTHPLFQFSIAGGTALLDDAEIWQVEAGNGTAFRNDMLAMLAQVKPGILRTLQMGGSTVSNTIMPPLGMVPYMSNPWEYAGSNYGRNATAYGMHEFFQLCETQDCEAWFSLPGTLRADEMRQYMEYIGAASNVGLGTLRAALGHPLPWTETLRRIHVEFGNEAWNTAAGYLAGGFNGPDYWSNLFAIARASQYYTNTLLLHAAGQNFSASMSRRIIADTPAADHYAIAPYVLHNLDTNDLILNNTDEQLFHWLAAYHLELMNAKGMPEQGVVMTNTGVEFSVYEFNHHTTRGPADAASINKLLMSLAAGVDIGNSMLTMLKKYKMRSQCFFTFIQHHFNSTDLPSGTNEVRLWGGMLNMRAGQQRMRPTGMAVAAINQALQGDLVATTHGGDNPQFSAHGRFYNFTTNRTVRYPALQSYAFKDGAERGLVICNLDVTSQYTVALAFDLNVISNVAATWLMTGSYMTNNNEFETSVPQVVLTNMTIAGFTNGVLVTMPPASLRALRWQVVVPEPLLLGLPALAWPLLRVRRRHRHSS